MLIVDDSASLRLFLTEVLRGAGYEVQQANHGQQAPDMIAAASLDLVLSDIHRPRLDGLSLLPQAQTVATTPRPMLKSGTVRHPPPPPVPFLVKPVDAEVLLDLFDALLAA